MKDFLRRADKRAGKGEKPQLMKFTPNGLSSWSVEPKYPSVCTSTHLISSVISKDNANIFFSSIQ